MLKEMAQHQTPCEICQQLLLCRDGTHPRLIARMETGYAVLGPRQYWRGYSLLLCDQPFTELDELPSLFRAAFLNDMTRLARAVREVVEPHKLNYECLGNVVHHLHWHIFPRFLEEPSPLSPVWQVMPPEADPDPFAFNLARDLETILALREALQDD